MAADGGGIFGFIVVAAALTAIHGWFSDKSKKLKEDEFNSALRQQLGKDKRQLVQEADEIARNIQKRTEHLETLSREFDVGYLRGRKWLANFIAEAEKANDELIEFYLLDKKKPAVKGAEEVAKARAERRAWKERAKFLEYQLASYKEYFPFLEEYEDIILDEAIPLSPDGANLEAVENSDPVLFYVPKAEYEKLSSSDRNQLALERYLSHPLSRAGIGRFYERYLGYLYEKEGWKVEYYGIVEGYEDLGRDLICKKSNQIEIVQAKCWASEKIIHEKHIFQLFGTTQLYLMNHQQNDLFDAKVSAVFITTASLSPVARKAAQWLKIDAKERFALDKAYPIIKCNINQSSKEKIYHLPFDQQYDRTKIVPELGEFYATTVAEAESKGFRRAFRYFAS